MMSDTNAVKWLRAQGVEFRVLEYEFSEVGSDHAAEELGLPLEMICKTLVVRTAEGTYWLAIVPGDQRFDTRSMAAAIGVRQADIAPPAEAERVTGYKVGGISPFAQRRKLPVLIEESLLALETLVVSGGRRGVLVEIASRQLVNLLGARPADLCPS
jgi:Cys-tRNA(Pro)/Cys-tRNA(Cys) deacylase